MFIQCFCTGNKRRRQVSGIRNVPVLFMGKRGVCSVRFTLDDFADAFYRQQMFFNVNLEIRVKSVQSSAMCSDR